MKSYKAAKPMIWVRSKDTDNTYICPLGALDDPRNASEEQLRAACLNESENPQNN